MLVILGNKDLTKYVLSDSYDIQLTRKFEEWTDANYKKHRIYTANKVSGSFGLICGSSNGITVDELLNLITSNTENDVLTITVFVKNTNAMESIECFYTLENKQFDDKGHAVYTLKLEEC